MRTYLVKYELSHNKVPYAPGRTIELTPEQAEPLLKIGVITQQKSNAESPETPAVTETGGGASTPTDPYSVFDQAVERDLIQRSGNWFSYQGQNLGNGRSRAVTGMISLGLVETIHQQLN